MNVATQESPDRLAEQLTGRDYISYSAISTFQACPLRYYFRYWLGLPEEAASASLVFGGAIHAAVEHHFRELLVGNLPPTIDTLVDVYHDAWKDVDLGTVQFGRDGDAATMGRLARRMLAVFQAHAVAHPAGRIIGIEEELYGPIVPDCPDLLARVDLLVDRGDALVLTDFKTARSRWTQQHAEGSAMQLLLYHELLKPMANGRPVQLQFGVLAKTKEAAIDVHVIEPDSQQLDRTKHIVEQVWQAIAVGHFYPNPSPVQCPACPHRQACRNWTG